MQTYKCSLKLLEIAKNKNKNKKKKTQKKTKKKKQKQTHFIDSICLNLHPPCGRQ